MVASLALWPAIRRADESPPKDDKPNLVKVRVVSTSSRLVRLYLTAPPLWMQFYRQGSTIIVHTEAKRELQCDVPCTVDLARDAEYLFDGPASHHHPGRSVAMAPPRAVAQPV